jgi:Glycosyl hydrolases family 28
MPLPVSRRQIMLGSLTLGGAGFVSDLARGDDPAPATATDGFNVRRFGAKADGKQNDAKSIQSAIDACQRAGGGKVHFPAGTFLSGSLHLKSNVALHLDHGAVLLASKEPNDFDPIEKLPYKNAADRETSFFHQALIWAEGQERIAVSGSGTIDCNRTKRGGPKAIAFKECQQVKIRDITISNAPNYAISLLGTDYVDIDGVTILNAFADGIDPDCCHHVRIANCHIESWDDAICPKSSFSLGRRRSVENLVVTNCVLATNCNAFKLGTESGGDFKNISLSNCAFFTRPNRRPAISGISLLSVDGAHIDGLTISNIAMNGPRCPIFLRLGNRGRDLEQPVPGSVKNVVISNIVAMDAQEPCIIAGLPGHPVEAVTLDNLRLVYRAHENTDKARVEVPEVPAKYPSADMFGPLPSYALYCRHVKDMQVSRLALAGSGPQSRPAVVCDDVEDFFLDALDAGPGRDGTALMRLLQVRGALIRGCFPKRGTQVFLEVSGNTSAAIRAMANDLSRVERPLAVAPEVATEAVHIE